MFAFRNAQSRQESILTNPFFGNDTQRTVVQADGAVAARQGRQQFGKRNRPPFEVDTCRKLEPVDPRFDLEIERTGLVHLPAVGVNLPSLPEQTANDAPQRLGGDLDVAAPMKCILQPAGPELHKIVPGGFLTFAIARDAAA